MFAVGAARRMRRQSAVMQGRGLAKVAPGYNQGRFQVHGAPISVRGRVVEFVAPAGEPEQLGRPWLSLGAAAPKLE